MPLSHFRKRKLSWFTNLSSDIIFTNIIPTKLKTHILNRTDVCSFPHFVRTKYCVSTKPLLERLYKMSHGCDVFVCGGSDRGRKRCHETNSITLTLSR
jgi:hypothetical protein